MSAWSLPTTARLPGQAACVLLSARLSSPNERVQEQRWAASLHAAGKSLPPAVETSGECFHSRFILTHLLPLARPGT